MKKIHIITGGSSGIGFEVAKRFREGLVLITGRGEDKLIEASQKLRSMGLEVAFKTSDISDPASLVQLFDYAKSLGEIKTIVNSAGVSGVGVPARTALEIDLLGTYQVIETSLNYIGEEACLILIASMMGYAVVDGDYNQYLEDPTLEGAIDALVEASHNDSNLAYNFSKKGVQLLVKRYASAFGQKGARILSVSPGIIMTPMVEKAAAEYAEQLAYMKSKTPLQKYGQPKDIANAIEFLASDQANFISGIDLPVDGGLSLNLLAVMKSQA